MIGLEFDFAHGKRKFCKQVDQAALTGESLPVKKFPGHIAFSGSTIKQGEQEALVYATGKNTFFGRAAALIAGTNAVANIQKVGEWSWRLLAVYALLSKTYGHFRICTSTVL